MSKINLVLSEGVSEELRSMAQSSGYSASDVVRTALALLKIAYSEQKKGNKLAVMDKGGETYREITIP